MDVHGQNLSALGHQNMTTATLRSLQSAFTRHLNSSSVSLGLRCQIRSPPSARWESHSFPPNFPFGSTKTTDTKSADLSLIPIRRSSCINRRCSDLLSIY